MASGASLVFFTLLICPFVLHWGLQYRHRLEECIERHYINQDLLRHQVCADPSYRHRFGEKIDCRKAETEMASGHYLCAWNLWKTHDFEPYSWLVTLFNSNWLYFILFGAVLTAIWAYFQKSRDLAMQRQHMDWCAQSLNSLTTMDRRHHHHPLTLREKSQKTIGWKSHFNNRAGRRVPSARRRRRTPSWDSSSSSSESSSLD